MLKKKHEEAKELLVRAIVSNNNLLILNHPMFEEKISFKTIASSILCLWNLFCMQMILDILDNRKHSYGSKVCHTVDAQGSSKLIILKNCCCIYVLLSDTHFKFCDGCLCRAIFRDNIFSSLLQFLPGIGECP